MFQGDTLYKLTYLLSRDASHIPGGRLPLLSIRTMVTLLASEHHRPLASTRLYCLVTDAQVCMRPAKGNTRQPSGWDSNPRPLDHQSNAESVPHTNNAVTRLKKLKRVIYLSDSGLMSKTVHWANLAGNEHSKRMRVLAEDSQIRVKNACQNNTKSNNLIYDSIQQEESSSQHSHSISCS